MYFRTARRRPACVTASTPHRSIWRRKRSNQQFRWRCANLQGLRTANDSPLGNGFCFADNPAAISATSRFSASEKNMKKLEEFLETVIFNSRWLLAPFYL